MPRPTHLTTIALAAAALYICALARDNTLLALLAKPIPVLALIAWLRNVPATPYCRWITFGLAFSVLGDILLAIPADLFVFGLVAFLCAHLAYLRAYCGQTLRPALPAFLFSALTGITLFGVLASHGLGPLLIPVAVYALARAGLRRLPVRVFRQPHRPRPFRQPFAAAQYLIIEAYWLGEWAIAASAQRQEFEKSLTQSGASGVRG